MIETLISSSVLIIVIIIVRTVFKGRINSRIRYSLWLIAAVRLMLPFGLVQSGISVMNIIGNMGAESLTEDTAYVSEQAEPYTYTENYAYDTVIQSVPIQEEGEEYSEKAVFTIHERDAAAGEYAHETVVIPEKKPVNIKSVLKMIWLTVTAAMLIWFAAVNTVFYKKLKSTRKDFEYQSPIKMYTVKGLSSPCIFGLFSPSVYIPERSADDKEAVMYITAHELCHYYHGDMIWTVLRYVLLAVYWFDPFVWIASMLSKQDCECACDEAAIKMLGKEKRFSYGKTIIDLIPRKHGENFGVASTSMSSSKDVLKERMRLIASVPRNRKAAVFFTVFVLFISAAATFTSALEYEKTDAVENTVQEEETEEQPDSIEITVTDKDNAENRLVYYPAPEGYEPYIYLERYSSAEECEPYFGETLDKFICDSAFSAMEITIEDNKKELSKSSDRDGFEAAVNEICSAACDYSDKVSEEVCGKIIFSRMNGGFSSSLEIEFFRDGEKKLAVISGNDFSQLVRLVLSDKQSLTEEELEEAYNSSGYFCSKSFYADELYDYFYSVCTGEDNTDTENKMLSYESFGTDRFSGEVSEQLDITGENYEDYVLYEYENIAFAIPEKGSVSRIGELLLWQQGGLSFKIAPEDSPIPSETGSSFNGMPCIYNEDSEKLSLVISDGYDNTYMLTAEYGDPQEKNTAVQILGSVHVLYRPVIEYVPPVRISAEPSVYSEDNDTLSEGHSYNSELCAMKPGIIMGTYFITDTSREYETDFSCYIERKEPDGKWYRVIPLADIYQENKNFKRFYTKEESSRINACLDLAAYPLLPEGEYRLVKPFRAAGSTVCEYGAFSYFHMSDTLEPENELFCSAECTEKSIRSSAETISYIITSSKSVFGKSDIVDIEREENGVWRSVRKSGIYTNSLYAGYSVSVSGKEHTVNTLGFDISVPGKYRLRISCGNFDEELDVNYNGYDTAYAEFTVT